MTTTETRAIELKLWLMALVLSFVAPIKSFAGLDGSQFHKSYNYQINLSGTSSILTPSKVLSFDNKN